ncbi:MAG: PA14 domain-containing protein, partial [bacterium]
KARLEAYWSGPGFLPMDSGCNEEEWCASYYGNRHLDGRVVFSRNEGSGTINQVWNDGGPGYGFPTDNFSVRWVRKLKLTPGRYRFHIQVDDGGRLSIGNQTVIDQWKDQGVTEYTYDIDIFSEYTPIKFEYYENGGGAIAKLWWEVLQTIPQEPTNFRVLSATSDSITLAWDDVGNESGYKIYKWGSDGNKWGFFYYANVGQNITNFTDDDLSCENDFNYYELSAYNAFGESEHVGWIQGKTATCPPPLNDSIRNPVNISYLPFDDYAYNIKRATTDNYDLPLTLCNLDAGKSTVWYRFSPSLFLSPTFVSIDTFGSNYDTILGVWSGEPGNLTLIACNDDSNQSGQSSLYLFSPPGAGYYISVGKFNDYLQNTTSFLEKGEAQSGEELILMLSIRNLMPLYLPIIVK